MHLLLDLGVGGELDYQRPHFVGHFLVAQQFEQVIEVVLVVGDQVAREQGLVDLVIFVFNVLELLEVIAVVVSSQVVPDYVGSLEAGCYVKVQEVCQVQESVFVFVVGAESAMDSIVICFAVISCARVDERCASRGRHFVPLVCVLVEHFREYFLGFRIKFSILLHQLSFRHIRGVVLGHLERFFIFDSEFLESLSVVSVFDLPIEKLPVQLDLVSSEFNFLSDDSFELPKGSILIELQLNLLLVLVEVVVSVVLQSYVQQLAF